MASVTGSVLTLEPYEGAVAGSVLTLAPEVGSVTGGVLTLTPILQMPAPTAVASGQNITTTRGNARGAASYSVRWSTNGANWSGWINRGSATTYQRTPGWAQTIHFQWRANNAYGSGPESASASATTTPGPPAAPAAPTLSNVGFTLTATWPPAAHATSYRLTYAIRTPGAPLDHPQRRERHDPHLPAAARLHLPRGDHL